MTYHNFLSYSDGFRYSSMNYNNNSYVNSMSYSRDKTYKTYKSKFYC